MFVEIAVSLTTKGFTLPGVLSPSIKYETKPIDSANIEESFVKGIDFLEYQFLESSTAQNSDGEQTTQTDETSDTVKTLVFLKEICRDRYIKLNGMCRNSLKPLPRVTKFRNCLKSAKAAKRQSLIV